MSEHLEHRYHWGRRNKLLEGSSNFTSSKNVCQITPHGAWLYLSTPRYCTSYFISRMYLKLHIINYLVVVLTNICMVCFH